MLTFLASVELDPDALRKNGKEAFGIGLVGFIAFFLPRHLLPRDEPEPVAVAIASAIPAKTEA